MTDVTFEEVHGPDPIDSALQSQGITPTYLAKKLKRELNAKETKTFNQAGQVIYSKPLVAWHIRQKARMDAHKLLNHYPAEKHEHTGPDGGPMEIKYVNDWRGRNGD